MAWVEIEVTSPVVKLYASDDKNHANCIGFNSAAWRMIGFPTIIDVFYDSTTGKLALRNGRRGGNFLVTSERDNIPYHVYAEEVYEAAGIELAENIELTPQAFTWGVGEPDAELAHAVWVQLP